MTEYTSVGADVEVHDELCTVTTYFYTGYVKEACDCALITKVREGVAQMIIDALEANMPPISSEEYAIYNAFHWLVEEIRKKNER